MILDSPWYIDFPVISESKISGFIEMQTISYTISSSYITSVFVANSSRDKKLNMPDMSISFS
ncbi:MAG: hypothetical protein DRJ01_04985 [Bacteroidetes bacterium]|nr:MAG: hypothetical protein DRJ01_04985 [Bacteroidota bacterium]